MELEKVVARYGENDAKMKELKKLCDGDKVTIKNALQNSDTDTITAGGYTVKCTVSNRESLNENKMLSILKQDWETRYPDQECPYIKTREYVDMDELESVLYAGDLPADVLKSLDDCREVTEVVTLRCTKAKENKSND